MKDKYFGYLALAIVAAVILMGFIQAVSPVNFNEAVKLSDKDFAEYAEKENAAYRAKMKAEGMVYFPTLDRWYPIGTKIAGVVSP